VIALRHTARPRDWDRFWRRIVEVTGACIRTCRAASWRRWVSRPAGAQHRRSDQGGQGVFQVAGIRARSATAASRWLTGGLAHRQGAKRAAERRSTEPASSMRRATCA